MASRINRIKQFSVVECQGQPGRKAVPTGNRLAFFAYTAKECHQTLAQWLGRGNSGWKAAKTRHSVRNGSVVWMVVDGCTVP